MLWDFFFNFHSLIWVSVSKIQSGCSLYPISHIESITFLASSICEGNGFWPFKHRPAWHKWYFGNCNKRGSGGTDCRLENMKECNKLRKKDVLSSLSFALWLVLMNNCWEWWSSYHSWAAHIARRALISP